MRVIILLMMLVWQVAQADVQKDHTELRGLLTGIENAINAQEYNKLAQYFSANMYVTPINQEVLRKHSDIEPYFEKWFGKNGKVHKLVIKLVADEKTHFYGENIGVVCGSGTESYILSDSRKFDMKTRWTATVIKESDGKWRILALHIGTDFMNNPLLEATENSVKYFGIGGLALGLIIGLISGAVLWRRKRT